MFQKDLLEFFYKLQSMIPLSSVQQHSITTLNIFHMAIFNGSSTMCDKLKYLPDVLLFKMKRKMMNM
jgi:hypothetical protein